ncbi:MAG: DUF5916 domain-containing protein [Ferruginibacter sp.]
MIRLIIYLFLSVYSIASTAQSSPKQLAAKRTTSIIKIDGILDEPAWKDAPAALGYTEFRPTPFRKEDTANRTEAYMLYNDEGLYFGGYCHERTKDSISAELNGRDGFGNNDFIGFTFDTYNDKINGFEYFITPLGEQMDAKFSPNPNGNNEDFTWNAVWQSAARIHNDGWSWEIFIPFSAIRFSKKPIQDWGFNITRRRQKTLQQVTWNPIDQNVNGYLTQEGIWKGLENIKPPLRLQFSPYFSVYANHYPFNKPGERNWASSVNGGMDVKYGISQALTLDMTLIPDFGQVQSDKEVLNLSPFEVKFNENRSFFTEGTELFNKGNLFYSRRIGGIPLHYYEVQNSLNANEHIVSNPGETKLINATKISGRLQNGLGIGFFNAETRAQFAVVADDSGYQRKIQTNPLTNYNIMVLNQSLKYNSSLTLINTNVLRSGHDYDANVTAALFDFNDKKNTWNVGGKVATSSLIGYLPGHKTERGYSHSVYFGKVSGRFNFNVEQDLTDGKFNSNDLGYFTNNNFLTHSFYAGYRWVKPTTWYNNIYLNFNATYSQLYKPLTYENANFNVNANGQLKNLWQAGGLFAYEPTVNNFYEARIPGRLFKGWSDWFTDGWIQTNNAKKYYVYAEASFVSRSFFKSKRYLFDFKQTFRFSPKFSIGQETNLQPQTNNVGFADFEGNDIIFGRRDVSTVENTFNIKYSFNDRMIFTTIARHYWSKVNYKEYFTLQPDGSLGKNTGFAGNADQNYNSFTVDAVYTWQFAPGSFINVVWKNNATTFDGITTLGYFKNFDHTITSPQNNNFSIKVIYFLDYLRIKDWGRKKQFNTKENKL